MEGFRRICPYPQIRRLTVYTRLPGPVSEEQSAQKAKLEALSAMVQISWKEPEQKAAKAQKYKLSKPTEPVLTFTSFNFKLAVMEVLMYEKGLLAPKLDAHEFAREYSRRKIDIDAEGYEPIPEIRKWLEKYPVPERLAPEVTEIEMDGGSEIYTQLCPFWDARMEPLILIPLRRRNCASSPISNILPSCPPSRNRCCRSGTVRYQGRLAVR